MQIGSPEKLSEIHEWICIYSWWRNTLGNISKETCIDSSTMIFELGALDKSLNKLKDSGIS